MKFLDETLDVPNSMLAQLNEWCLTCTQDKTCTLEMENKEANYAKLTYIASTYISTYVPMYAEWMSFNIVVWFD